MKEKTNILFLIITISVAFVTCMYLGSCKCESKPNPLGSPQSSKIFEIDNCRIYYVEVTHDNHEYLISNSGGIIHKVNCKFCINQKDLKNENNNSN